ncbi:hypothetical protein [Pseudomonas sp. JAI120]|uniref:hypothetical protein n=1 Tax=Pseudomonas sp. JAI120 TaxID=2723063 RepID=UPI0030DDA621
MKRLPEGVRRICAVVGVLFVIWWVAAIGFFSDGFIQVQPIGWVMLGLGAILAYVIPALLYRIYRWIRDGFAIDAQR